MDFFAGKLNEPIEVEKERHYLDVEYKYREIAKKCAKLTFDWGIKQYYTYEDPVEFNKKFIKAKFEYESNKVKNAIANVRKASATDMLLKLHKGKTERRIQEEIPFKKSDFFSTAK